MKRVVSSLMLTLLICSAISVFCIQPIKTSEAIYANAEGSTNSLGNSSQREEDVYTFIDKNHDPIWNEGDNMHAANGVLSRDEQRETQKKRWINYFDGTENGSWIFTGDSPYLHNDIDSYITSMATGNCSWFHFQDTSLTTLQTVYLIIEWKTRHIVSTEEAELYLDNGSFEADLGSFNLTLEYRWTKINVTSQLQTISEVNDAKLKVVALSAGFHLVAVRRAYLRIYNGPVPLQVGTPTYGKVRGQVTLSVKWTDPDGLSGYALYHNASGNWIAQTGTLEGIEAWSNHTITLQNDTASVLAYRFWANDTYNNWEQMEILYVCPVKNFSPDLLQYIEDVSGSPIAHSYGRKDFHDNVTGRFWKFYSDGTNIKCTSTKDGQTWKSPQTIRGGDSGYQFYVHGFNGTIHYLYNSERTGDNMYYRKGILKSDVTITWVTSEQVAVDAGTAHRFYACSVVTDTDGYPYLVFGNRTDQNSKTLNLAKSSYNIVTWKTASGFPKQINDKPDNDLVSGVALTLPDNKIYMIYCSAGGEEPPMGRLWHDPNLGPLENASDNMMSSNYHFSAVSDSYGHVHIVYRRTNSRVDYSFRNYTTGEWEVKDEFVTSHLTSESLGSSIYSWPVICWNPDSEEIYVHWWTLEDKSAWLKIRNSTMWEQRRRIIRLNSDVTLIDGDVIVAQSYQNQILLNFVVQNVLDEHKAIWAYLYTNKPPVASFTESAETVYTWEVIVFNASDSFDPDGTIVCYFWNLGDGTNATGAITEHEYTDDGNYTVTLTVTDDDGATDEASSTKTVLRRDVAVLNVIPYKTIVGTGFNMSINVTTQNQGNFTENFNVTTYANSTVIGVLQVTLNPGDNQTLTFTWNTTNFVYGNYTISATADLVPGEIDMSDNAFVDGWVFVTIPGDVDGDRDVDIYDIVRMSGLYGVSKPDPQYDPNCDIDGDGDIDIFDIVAAAGNYGENW